MKIKIVTRSCTHKAWPEKKFYFNRFQLRIPIVFFMEMSKCFALECVSLQCRRFLWARNLLAKAPCWNFPKRGGDGVSQRERGGGGEREEKTPARKHCENEKHPLIRRAWPLFRKWVADNNKTTKQSLQSKDSHCLKKNKLEFIIVFIFTESQCNSTADEASV